MSVSNLEDSDVGKPPPTSLCTTPSDWVVGALAIPTVSQGQLGTGMFVKLKHMKGS